MFESMSRHLQVTLLSSDNTYLKYPCNGILEIWETRTNFSIIAVFRGIDNEGNQVGGPVDIKNPIFTYNGKIKVSSQTWKNIANLYSDSYAEHIVAQVVKSVEEKKEN